MEQKELKALFREVTKRANEEQMRLITAFLLGISSGQRFSKAKA